MHARRDLDRSLNAVLFGMIEMTLHFDKHVAFPEDRNQIFDVEARFCFPASGKRGSYYLDGKQVTLDSFG